MRMNGNVRLIGILVLAMLVLASVPVGAESIANQVVISEIQTDSTEGLGGSYDDFIELYNPTSVDIDLATVGYRLERWTSGGTKSIVVRFGDTRDATFHGMGATNTTIAAHGFYLVVDDATDVSLKAKADALVTKTFALGDDYAVGLGTGSMDGPTDEDTIDFVGWGDPYGDLYEGSGAASNPSEGKSIQRKVNATINEDGVHGPAWDSNNNDADFFIHSSDPQNTGAEPVLPIPEFSTLILFSTGLIALAGYVLLKRR